jgi:hypothetical protein
VLHIRATVDSVPEVGTASRHARVLTRTAADAAPAYDVAPAVLVLGRIPMMLIALFTDPHLLLLVADAEARAPPGGRL